MALIMSLVGMVTLIAIAPLFSYDRTSIRLRTVVGPFAIQAGIGALVVGLGACTDSGVNRSRFAGMDFAAIADFDLTRHAVDAAAALEVPVKVGNLFSADLFYDPRPDTAELLKRYTMEELLPDAFGPENLGASNGAAQPNRCRSQAMISRDS